VAADAGRAAEGADPFDWRYISAWAPPGGPIEIWSSTELGAGDPVYVPVDDTIHLAWQAPAGRTGVSPLHQLAVTPRLEDAAQRLQTASFRNGTRTGGYIIPPEKWTKQQANDSRSSGRPTTVGSTSSTRWRRSRPDRSS
jgi:hypothetical protein